MTREEQINSDALKIVGKKLAWVFKLGVVWADAHPKETYRESQIKSLTKK